MRPRVSLVTVGLAGLLACSAPPVEDGFADVSALTGERLSQRIEWRRDGAGGSSGDSLDAAVAALLRQPLSASAAVQIALLENRSLQAAYEELGVSQADVVEAGLLRNPVFSLRARFADSAPRGTNFEFGVVQDFLDVLQRPARRGLAEAEFERVKRDVAAEVVLFAAEVESAYYQSLGDHQVAAMRALIVEAADASADLARRMHTAGNISDLRFSHEQGLLEDARVALALAATEALASRERLNGLLGLWRAEQLDWTLPDGLPDVPGEPRPSAELEALALANRLDLQASADDVDVAARDLGLTEDWRLLPLFQVGLSSERDTDGQIVFGPELAFELPLFDRGEARVARLEARLHQALQRHAALGVQVRTEVRTAAGRLVALRELVERFRTVIIPLREARVAYTQQEFNFMLLGAFELIQAKQAEFDAYQAYIEAVRDAWITRVELDRALGGRIHDDPPQVAATAYTCPMHTEVRTAEPGRCPECGMALVPAAPAAHDMPGMHERHDAPAPPQDSTTPSADPHAGHEHGG